MLGGSFGNATNLGTMNLSSDNGDMILTDYATLYNYGTIIQTGTGNFGLASDGADYTTLDNEAGAYYLLESNSRHRPLGRGHHFGRERRHHPQDRWRRHVPA